jgi:aspartokinase/homoserine dehydrogenase 1
MFIFTIRIVNLLKELPFTIKSGMNMNVLKFGGSSVGSAERIAGVLKILSERVKSGRKITVVFSAVQGVTDKLIEASQAASRGEEGYQAIIESLQKIHVDIINQLISVQNRSAALTHIKILLKNLEEVLYGVFLVKELTPKTLDFIMSFGERFSAFIINSCLTDRGIDSVFIDSRAVLITDDRFGAARIDFKRSYAKIEETIDGSHDSYIVTGFIASTPKHETTTLGRGGSDLSASVFGSALRVNEIEIWTDVDGVMTADPRKVKDAFSVKQMSYEEAMELSHFGAKVIHPPTMQPALDREIPIRIKNTFNPAFEGTLITKETDSGGFLIKGLSSIDNMSLVYIQGSGMVGSTGIAERIFKALALANVNIIMISQASSEHSICVGVMPDCAKKAKKALKEELKYELHYGVVNDIQIEKNMAVIAVVGENMRRTKGIAGRVFSALGKNSINISAIVQGSSELNISMVVSNKDLDKALNTVHHEFYVKEDNLLNVFLVGTGLIGSTFLRLIADTKGVTGRDLSEILRVAGAANIDKMYLDKKGIDPKNWQTILEEKGEDVNLDNFVNAIKTMGLSNSVFVDCTASPKMKDYYPQLFEAGISVVTPNKYANADKYESYKRLRKSALEGGASFLYETNVGAGLPLIDTMQNLLKTGDEIERIEGILSGTLSYIFNVYDGSESFSAVVKKAKEQGYTEPDPREDLSGNDVARKILILAREAGAELDIEDVELQGLLPEEAKNASTVEVFFDILAKFDDEFKDKLDQAEAENKKLRYIAVYEKGRAKVRLMRVGAEHPFYSMAGSDNIIALYTKFYNDTPLVVKGPGAGADVTAAGVLADVLKLVPGK